MKKILQMQKLQEGDEMHNEEDSADAKTGGRCKSEFHKLCSKLKLGRCFILRELMFWK